MVKLPELLLTVLRSDLLSRSVSNTVAWGIIAPVVSFTTPDTVPVVSCARAGGCHSRSPDKSSPDNAATCLILGNNVIATTPLILFRASYGTDMITITLVKITITTVG
jgi:hypothetical protein